MEYKPMREYVFNVAKDKKQLILLTMRDKLAEAVKTCETEKEVTEGKAVDLFAEFSIWVPKFAKIDELVKGYAIRTARQGDSLLDALETVKQILEL